MTSHWLRSLGAAALAAALILPAGASAQQSFATWDADADSLIGEEEWNAGFGDTNVFGDWDANGDGGIDEAEFFTGVGAGAFDAAEFGNFAAWDASGDGKLDQAEFNRGFFGFYDRDDVAGLSEAEFGESGSLFE